MTGSAYTPVDIEAGALQSYVFTLTADGAIAPTDVSARFDCADTAPAPMQVGINTLLFSASETATRDIVALAATTTNDGIVSLAGPAAVGAFAVATVNVVVGGILTVSVDTGGIALSANLAVCETSSATGQCVSAVGESIVARIDARATPTFAIFVAATDVIPFDPATRRIFARFKDAGGVTRGPTSVAVRTQ